MTEKMSNVVRIGLSMGVSLLLVWALYRLLTVGLDPADHPQLLTVLQRSTRSLIGLYLLVYLVTLVLRTIRFRLLIGAAGELRVPSFFHTGLVTQVRNMTVDLLPSRIGELSYVAMLNRGCGVSGKACLSSLIISFLFDIIALFFIVTMLIVYQFLRAEVGGWMLRTALVILLLGGVLFAGVFLGLPKVVRWVAHWPLPNAIARLGNKVIGFVEEVVNAVNTTRCSGVLGRITLLSILVRSSKYVGLYLLFLAVVGPSFPHLATAPIPDVVTATVAAEGAASLPVPTFMSFGTYEASGTAVLTLLGFSAMESLVAVLGMHIWSQVIDYGLGGLALIAFLLVVRRVDQDNPTTPTHPSGTVSCR